MLVYITNQLSASRLAHVMRGSSMDQIQGNQERIMDHMIHGSEWIMDDPWIGPVHDPFQHCGP